MAAKAATKKATTSTTTPAKATRKAAAAPAKAVLTPDPVRTSPGAPPYPQTPVLGTAPAILTLVLNAIIWPGIGTFVASIVGHHKMIGRAVAQFLLAIVIVGWVWGVITGVQALVNWSWGKKNGLVQ